MAGIGAELKQAIATSIEPLDQSVEFKRRFRRLIENVLDAPVSDADVREVLDLYAVEVEEE